MAVIDEIKRNAFSLLGYKVCYGRRGRPNDRQCHGYDTASMREKLGSFYKALLVCLMYHGKHTMMVIVPFASTLSRIGPITY